MSPVGGLTRQSQGDFAVGSQIEVSPALAEEQSSREIRNAFIADDATMTMRGGTTALSEAFGEGRAIWDGWLTPGRRTLVASTEAFGVLDVDGSIVELSPDLGSGGMIQPRPMRAIEGLLFIPPGWLYAGSRKAAFPYSAGVVGINKGSKILHGTSTRE
jgi:hypothetical protein